MRRAVQFTVTISNRVLITEFKRQCKLRGRKQSWVIENAMRYYIEHPQANGWGNGVDVEKKKTPRKEIQKKS